MRKHLVKTAAHWFNASRIAEKESQMAKSVFCMENAYNHVENALAHILERIPGAREEFDRVNKSNG